jgi:hypothetical protein
MISKTFQVRGRLVNVKYTYSVWKFIMRTTVDSFDDPDMGGHIEDVSWGLVIPHLKITSISTEKVIARFKHLRGIDPDVP